MSDKRDRIQPLTTDDMEALRKCFTGFANAMIRMRDALVEQAPQIAEAMRRFQDASRSDDH